MKETKK